MVYTLSKFLWSQRNFAYGEILGFEGFARNV
jgi:hypothetical protein